MPASIGDCMTQVKLNDFSIEKAKRKPYKRTKTPPDTWTVESVYETTKDDWNPKAQGEEDLFLPHDYVIIVIRNLRTQKTITVKDKIGYGTGKLDTWSAYKGRKFKMKDMKRIPRLELLRILQNECLPTEKQRRFKLPKMDNRVK